MATLYKVWVCVEEYDTEREEGEDMDLPFGSVRDFKRRQDAVDFATALHNRPPLVWRGHGKKVSGGV
jgi:hypothetical protein